MENYLIKGILIGLLFGIPVGAVGALTVKRTITHGKWSGMLTGLGSSVADCLYACVGAFGLTFISDFLLEYSIVISILGGCLIVIMGISALTKKNKEVLEKPNATKNTKMFLSSFAIGITNPAVILTFLFAFTFFNIAGQLNIYEGIMLVLGVLIGTLIWWGILISIAGLLKKKRGEKGFANINKVFGVILIMFGAVVMIRTIQ